MKGGSDDRIVHVAGVKHGPLYTSIIEIKYHCSRGSSAEEALDDF